MNKNMVKVFVIIGLLVVVFVAWQLIFNDGGILKTAYNALISPINETWNTVTGGNDSLIPTWDSTGVNQDQNLGDITNDTGL